MHIRQTHISMYTHFMPFFLLHPVFLKTKLLLIFLCDCSVLDKIPTSGGMTACQCPVEQLCKLSQTFSYVTDPKRSTRKVQSENFPCWTSVHWEPDSTQSEDTGGVAILSCMKMQEAEGCFNTSRAWWRKPRLAALSLVGATAVALPLALLCMCSTVRQCVNALWPQKSILNYIENKRAAYGVHFLSFAMRKCFS